MPRSDGYKTVLPPHVRPGAAVKPGFWGGLASRVYAAASARARQRRTARRPAPPTDTLIVSVGNLDVGGNGKTPLSIHLLESRGGVYVSRGYGSVAASLDLVSVVLPQDQVASSPAAGVRYLNRSDRLAPEVGDEAAVVAQRLPHVPLVVSRHKNLAIKIAVEHFSPQVIVLDDAFQSWDVPRHVDIVLVSDGEPLAERRLLPAGELREPAAALARADFVGVNAVDPDLDEWRESVAKAAGRPVPVFRLRRALSVPVGASAGRVASLCSIARPQRFEDMLVQEGIALRAAIRFPDHHVYRAADIEWLNRTTAAEGIATLVTTEKDAVKLRGVAAPSCNLAVAILDVTAEGLDWGEIQEAAGMHPRLP